MAALSSVGLLLVPLCGWQFDLAGGATHQSFAIPAHYLRVGNAMWFALVTLTTVGYGDRAPVSKTGRAITAVWMVISLIAVSSITAGLASASPWPCRATAGLPSPTRRSCAAL